MDEPPLPDGARAQIGSRALFPKLEAEAYLNHAAISPPSLLVEEAVSGLVAHYARRGVDAFGPWLAQRARLRSSLGALLSTPPESIAFLPNTTGAISAVANGLPWQKGDRVLCFRGEFPTNVTPWQRAAETFGLELSWLDLAPFARDPEEGLEAFRAALEAGVRLVAVSAVQFQTGLRMPIEAMASMAHEAGAELFCDAIQAVGVVPLDLGASDVDYLACGSHKWLMGLEGVGLLYVHPRRAEAFVPRWGGWLSHEEGLRFLFEGEGHLRYDRPLRPAPLFLEAGAPNAIGLAALEASLAPILHLGVDTIAAHVGTYLDALEAGLTARDFRSERTAWLEGRAGILSCRPPEGVDLAALSKALGARGIATSTPDGRLRFAPHWPNALSEVPRVFEAIDDCVR